jgi:hypothetical protein
MAKRVLIVPNPLDSHLISQKLWTTTSLCSPRYHNALGHLISISYCNASSTPIHITRGHSRFVSPYVFIPLQIFPIPSSFLSLSSLPSASKNTLLFPSSSSPTTIAFSLLHSSARLRSGDSGPGEFDGVLLPQDEKYAPADFDAADRSGACAFPVFVSELVNAVRKQHTFPLRIHGPPLFLR